MALQLFHRAKELRQQLYVPCKIQVILLQLGANCLENLPHLRSLQGKFSNWRASTKFCGCFLQIKHRCRDCTNSPTATA